jgi:hypothetical protein
LSRRRSGAGPKAPAAALLAAAALCACSDLRSESARITSARIAAENAVLIYTRTPKSVVFRDEVVRLDPDGPVVCGEYDGLNRNGEWIGFTRFIFADNQVAFDRGHADFQGRWAELCARR